MYKEFTCYYCGKELEFIGCEWATYPFPGEGEELVNVYACKVCKKQWTKRRDSDNEYYELDGESDYYEN